MPASVTQIGTPTANTSRAALQALAGIWADLVPDGEAGDFSAALATQIAAMVESGATGYLPGTLQRLTQTPQGALRVSAHDRTAQMAFAGPWGGSMSWSGSPW